MLCCIHAVITKRRRSPSNGRGTQQRNPTGCNQKRGRAGGKKGGVGVVTLGTRASLFPTHFFNSWSHLSKYVPPLYIITSYYLVIYLAIIMICSPILTCREHYYFHWVVVLRRLQKNLHSFDLVQAVYHSKLFIHSTAKEI